MFNFKTSGIIAGAAFILSFLIGLLSRTSAPMLLLRPVIFAVFFFIISNVIYILVNRFLPELLEKGGSDDDSLLLPGSRVNIVEGEEGNQAYLQRAAASGRAFMGAQPDDSDEGIGDVSVLLSGRGLNTDSAEDAPSGLSSSGNPSPQETLDQNAQNGYTMPRDLDAFAGADAFEASSANKPAVKSSQPEGPVVDMLPDLDSMAGAFLPSAANEGADTSDYSVSAPSPKQRPSSGSKAAGWAGDFNAKDMAAGLRTILNKDKEG